jgi:hypothetical protein
MKKETKEQKYARSMKQKGFIKMCIWINPKDSAWFSELAKLSRGTK